MKQIVRIRRGRGEKFRWHLYVDDVWHGMSRPFISYDLAVDAAKANFGRAITIELSSGNPDEDWPLYAGERDWAD